MPTLLSEMEEAERKAWDSVGRYKFQMFGYHAAIWVHLNRGKGPVWVSGVVTQTEQGFRIDEDFLVDSEAEAAKGQK